MYYCSNSGEPEVSRSLGRPKVLRSKSIFLAPSKYRSRIKIAHSSGETGGLTSGMFQYN